MNEINTTNSIMKDILESDFDSRVLRMPGGYMSRRYYKDQGLKELNAIKETKGETHIILLMHDAATKKATVEGLRDLIQYYKSQGYAFKVIENAPVDSFNKKVENVKPVIKDVKNETKEK